MKKNYIIPMTEAAPMSCANCLCVSGGADLNKVGKTSDLSGSTAIGD